MWPTKPDERRQKGEATRRRLLEKTLEVLMSEGIQGFTARNVAQRAGVSPATLFHHFPTLDDLLVDGVFFAIEGMMEAQHAQAFPSLHAYLEGLGTRMMGMLKENLMLLNISYVLMERAAFNPAVRNKMAEYHRFYLRQMESDLGSLLKTSAVGDLSHLSWMVMTLLDGLGDDFMVNHDLERIERLWQETANFITRTVAPAS
ncbi:MAG: TetR/AcrR family transcriptional regulator [Deltaproteobacteria bacterium]|nr:TetR/AcrR family transcriptional regulator [Deltaproteobacteria bacterium]